MFRAGLTRRQRHRGEGQHPYLRWKHHGLCSSASCEDTVTRSKRLFAGFLQCPRNVTRISDKRVRPLIASGSVPDSWLE